MRTLEKCGMCGERDMELLPTKSPGVEYFACPNCDNPRGVMPERKTGNP